MARGEGDGEFGAAVGRVEYAEGRFEGGVDSLRGMEGDSVEVVKELIGLWRREADREWKRVVVGPLT